MLSQNCNRTTAANAPGKPDPRLLRDDHILCLIMDAGLAVHAAARRWLKRHRTRQALAALDKHQLRDIGLTRSAVLSESARPSAGLAPRAAAARIDSTASKARPWWSGRDMSRRALAELDDDQLNNLSDTGRQVRRDARRACSGGCGGSPRAG
jgi:uncharacterized protein YjiS (DUF1127 family)